MKVVYFHMDMMQSYKWKNKIDLTALNKALGKQTKWFEIQLEKGEKGETATINLDKCWAIEYKEEIIEEQKRNESIR